MNLLTKLDQLPLETAAKTQLASAIDSLIEQARQEAEQQFGATLKAKDNEIRIKDLKIEALTLELSILRRTRFSVKSEALPAVQRDLFEDTWNEDLSAVEAQVEQIVDEQPCATVAKPKRPRAGRQPLPEHLPRIEHIHEPESCQCGL